MGYNKFEPESNLSKDESGLTFATLSGVCPEYPEEKAEPVVVARKSAAPSEASNLHASNPSVANSKTQELVTAIASEAVAQLAKAKINLPAGTSLMPAEATASATPASVQVIGKVPEGLQVIPTVSSASGAATITADASLGQTPMTITIQYKIYPDSQGKPQTIAVRRELADLINEAPPEKPSDVSSSASSTPSTPVPPINSTVVGLKQQQQQQQPQPAVMASASPAPVMQDYVETVETVSSIPSTALDAKRVPPVEVNPVGPDPAKQTRVEISPAGQRFEIPTIVTSGYDLDNLLCNFCKKVFKNDKTLMGHMLGHFGVAPKMVSCPVCGLTLQKKSYARHLRNHGNVIPEVCPFCQKEFREKRSLDKHIKVRRINGSVVISSYPSLS